MTLYEGLLFVHILAGIVWVGGGVALDLVAARIARTGDAAELWRFLQTLDWLGPRVFGPTSMVVLGLGLAMVAINDVWTIGQLWIVIALVLFAASFVVGMGFFGPESKRIAAAIEAGGPDSPEAQRRIRRLFLVSRLELVVLVVIVWDMVVKPGI